MNIQILENTLSEKATTGVIEPIPFIAGTFQTEEARDILMTLINDKINFHQKRNFSAIERFGVEDALSKQRLPQLLQIREMIINIIKEAEQHNKILILHSNIHITLEDNPLAALEETEIKVEKGDSTIYLD